MADTIKSVPGGIKGTGAETGSKEAEGKQSGKLGLATSKPTAQKPTAPKVDPRGTPPKTTPDITPLVNPQTSVYDDEALHLEETATPQPETPAEKEAVWHTNAPARKMAKREAAQTAVIVIALLDGIGTIFLGENASMQDYERDLIKEPLERILQRMDIVSSEALAKWSDPILLFMGLSAWITRVLRENRERETEVSQETETEQETTKTPVINKKGNNKRAEEVLLTEALQPPAIVKEGYRGQSNTIRP